MNRECDMEFGLVDDNWFDVFASFTFFFFFFICKSVDIKNVSENNSLKEKATIEYE